MVSRIHARIAELSGWEGCGGAGGALCWKYVESRSSGETRGRAVGRWSVHRPVYFIPQPSATFSSRTYSRERRPAERPPPFLIVVILKDLAALMATLANLMLLVCRGDRWHPCVAARRAAPARRARVTDSSLPPGRSSRRRGRAGQGLLASSVGDTSVTPESSADY